MAVTTSSTYANAILNEVLAQVPLKALTPKAVLQNLINRDSIDGAASLSKEYWGHTDIGAASAASEGTALSTTTTLSLASTITATPTEFASMLAEITTRAIRRKIPGRTADEVFAAFEQGDPSMMIPILEEEAMRMYLAGVEKLETDLATLLASLNGGTAVGSTGVNFSLANLLAAILALESNEPENEDFVLALAPIQVSDLRTEILSLSSGSSAIWTSQADASMSNFINDVSRNGLKGTVLGIPVYQMSSSIVQTANSGADVVGALMCRGVGAPDTPGSQRGALCFTEGHAPKFLPVLNSLARSVSLAMLWEGVAFELTDKHGVPIVTDAP